MASEDQSCTQIHARKVCSTRSTQTTAVRRQLRLLQSIFCLSIVCVHTID
jgi:hypothetical protein